MHIADYGCKLAKNRGFFECIKDGKTLGRIAIEDLRAVVLLNEAASISGSVVAALADCDAAIIHCKNFKPIAVTMPNIRTYDAKVVLNQSAGNKNLNDAIWRRILRQKVENNAECLRLMGAKNSRLKAMLAKSALNEALCAREYWKHYFPLLGEYGQRRDPEDESSKVNALLNYGYGIMGGIVHRSIIVAGLNYLLGVNHKTYYKNTPLVYDVIEPFRAFVDYALYQYASECPETNIKTWAVFFGKYLKNRRVKKGRLTMKLADSTDAVCESLANAYRNKKADEIWLPKLD